MAVCHGRRTASAVRHSQCAAPGRRPSGPWRGILHPGGHSGGARASHHRVCPARHALGIQGSHTNMYYLLYFVGTEVYVKNCAASMLLVKKCRSKSYSLAFSRRHCILLHGSKPHVFGYGSVTRNPKKTWALEKRNMVYIFHSKSFITGMCWRSSVLVPGLHCSIFFPNDRFSINANRKH